MSLRDKVKAQIAELQATLTELDTLEGKTYEIESAGNLRARVKSKPKTPKYATGITWLDEKLNGGFQEGSFINIAGESFSGKSTMVLNILANIAEYNKCLFFSFEMYENLLSHKIENLNQYQDKNLLIEQYRNDLDDVVGLIKLYASKGVKFVAIDSKMKIKVSGNGEDHQKASLISSTLAKLCQETGVIIMLINQISEADLRNGRFALKGSGDQVYDSDFIFFLTVKEDEKTVITKRTFMCTKDRYNGKKWKYEMQENSFISKSIPCEEKIYVPSI